MAVELRKALESLRNVSAFELVRQPHSLSLSLSQLYGYWGGGGWPVSSNLYESPSCNMEWSFLPYILVFTVLVQRRHGALVSQIGSFPTILNLSLSHHVLPLEKEAVHA